MLGASPGPAKQANPSPGTLSWYTHFMTKDDLVKFLDQRQFMVISTKSDNYPQSAVVEYGNDGLTLVFDTNNNSRKFKNISKDPRVSVVIGWDEETNATVQYEGNATLLDGDELNKLKQAYFNKNPEAQKWENAKGNVYFKVEPVWIRHTNLNPDPWDISVFDFKEQ